MQGTQNSAVRYTLGVMAQSATDAVQCAGGAIYDWAAAGWDVTVYAPDIRCHRAIDIVGAQCGEFETLLAETSWPKVLVITTGLHAANSKVKARAEHAVAAQTADVVFVGRDDACGDGFSRVMGSAARAFKKRAILATGAQIDVVGPSEHFCGLATPGSDHSLSSLRVAWPDESRLKEVTSTL